MSADELTSRFKSAIVPITTHGGPLRENLHGLHRAIRTFSTRLSFCISSGGVCNTISGSGTISVKSVADALFCIISRVGIPKEIPTDQDTAFKSRTLSEFYELLSIKSICTSVYHPQTDGLVVRFSRTLKFIEREDAKIGINGSSPCCPQYGRFHKPPQGFPHSNLWGA